jgi:DNA-directed RNA polymerase specialized sigma24 family protein
MAKEFDLDVTFEEAEPDLSTISTNELQQRINKLPESIRTVAQGLLMEKRTMSDVSQELGIRQAELVIRLHRAKLQLARNLDTQS